MNPITSLIEARQEAFDKKYTKGSFSDGYVTKAEIEDFHTQTIIAILEAQCALMEGRKKEQGQFEPFVCEDNFEVNAYNSALSEIIASNRELLKKIQS